jgi:hypothetical protein
MTGFGGSARGSGRGVGIAAAAIAFVSLWSAAPASAQETRVSRVDVENIGFAGWMRMERWVPLWVRVTAQGNDDAAVQVEVVDRDLDGDRVHYRRSTFVRELRSRAIEVYFRPRQRGGTRPGQHSVSIIVRDEQTREILIRKEFPFTLKWDQDSGAGTSGLLYAIDPNRRLVAFLHTGGPETAREAVRSDGTFQAFLKLFDPIAREQDANRFNPPPQPGAEPKDRVQDHHAAARNRFAGVDITEDHLPGAGFALESIDVLMWAPTGRENLSPAQRRAIAEWVAGGGRLFIFVGRNWKDVQSAFPYRPIPPNPGELEGSLAPTGLMPVVFGPEPAVAGKDGDYLRVGLRQFLGVEFNGIARAATAIRDAPLGNKPRPEVLGSAAVAPMMTRPAGEMVGFTQVRSWADYARDDRPELRFSLIVDSRFGAGGVTTVAFNPGQESLRSATDAVPGGVVPPMALFWKHLMHRTGVVPPVRESHPRHWNPNENDPQPADHLIKADGVVERALEDFRLAGVGPGTVLLLLIVYGILVGPAMWFVLKATNMLRWSWPIFAVLVIGSTVLSYMTVTVMRGVRTHRNRLTIVDIPAEGGATAGWHLESIYSPLDGEFRLTPPSARGWVAPYSPNDDDEADLSADLAGDSYFEDFGGGAAAELLGVPIRNHVKKFLARWVGGKPVGRLDVKRLHAFFDDPSGLAGVSEAVPHAGFWDDADRAAPAVVDEEGNPVPRRQTVRRVVRVEFEIVNNLDFDLDEALLFVWPSEIAEPPQMVVGHRPPPAGRRVTVSRRDHTGAPGAVVVVLGRIEKGKTARGAAQRGAHEVGRNREKPSVEIVDFRDWLGRQAGRFPVTPGHGGSKPEWRIDETTEAAALLSLRGRLAFDPALRERWALGGRTVVDEDYRYRATVRQAVQDARSLAVRAGSAAFLDVSAGMRPDEALLIARADGAVDVPTVTVHSARGSEVRPVERSSVVVRSRLPFQAELYVPRPEGEAPKRPPAP